MDLHDRNIFLILTLILLKKAFSLSESYWKRNRSYIVKNERKGHG